MLHDSIPIETKNLTQINIGHPKYRVVTTFSESISLESRKYIHFIACDLEYIIKAIGFLSSCKLYVRIALHNPYPPSFYLPLHVRSSIRENVVISLNQSSEKHSIRFKSARDVWLPAGEAYIHRHILLWQGKRSRLHSSYRNMRLLDTKLSQK